MRRADERREEANVNAFMIEDEAIKVGKGGRIDQESD
jgi:hypothetical protein